MDIKDVYVKSADILQELYEEFSSAKVNSQHREFLSLKLMASLIHNDVCREFYNLSVNPTPGTSKLLILCPIITKLFEANRWYAHEANKRLRQLAKSRGMQEFIENKFKEMKPPNPSRMEKYSSVRQGCVYYYSYKKDATISMLKELGSINVDELFEDFEMLLLYHLEWLEALRAIGKLEAPENAV
jgi:hypothetical protein